MEKTPSGTSVGVEDPYEHAGRCDHLADDGSGTCRFAVERASDHPSFAADLRERDYVCPAADPEDPWDWSDCPHYRYRSRGRSRECVRCGLAARRMAHTDERPLLEEHHLSYADGSETAHEITVTLCRWCHASVHDSWARIDDDVAPDPEAIAALEGRRSRELDEAGFETAAERFGTDGDGGGGDGTDDEARPD